MPEPNFHAGEFFMVAPDADTGTLGFLIRELKVNKFILFKRHTQDISSMTRIISEIRYLSHPDKPLIAVDEEGGLVSRLSHVIGGLPGAMAMANCRRKTLYTAVHIMHRAIRQLGFNLNFMPVLDILSNFTNSSISTRAYGYDRDTVLSCAETVMQAVRDMGVYCCYKHFPGLGRADRDSHYLLPQVNEDRSVLLDDILVYKTLFDNYVHHFVMMGHCHYPSLSGQISTFSAEIVQGLLKGKLGFTGAVVSDDLLMGALDCEKRFEKRAINAFKAGIDIMLVSKLDERFYRMYHAFEEAVRGSKICTGRLHDAKNRLDAVLRENSYAESYNSQSCIISEKLLRRMSGELYNKAGINKKNGSCNIAPEIEIHIPSRIESYSPVIEKHVFSSDGLEDLGEIAVRVYDSDKGPHIEPLKKDLIYIILSINPLYNENCRERLKYIDEYAENFYLVSMGEPQENSFIKNAVSIINLYTANRTVVLSALKRLLSDISK